MTEGAYRQQEGAAVVSALSRVKPEAVCLYADLVETMDDAGIVKTESSTSKAALMAELHKAGLCQRFGDVWRVTNAYLFLDDMQDPRRWVYFIEAVGVPAIKIRRSRRVGKHLSELQIGSPTELRVAARVPGDERVEGILHEAFAADHLHGERFARSDRLAGLIDELRRVGAR